MKEKKKKISLTTQIFAALILGCLCGVLMHYVVPSGYVKDTVFVNGIFYVIGNGFIRLMKMLVVPLVFVHWYAEVWQWVIRKVLERLA